MKKSITYRLPLYTEKQMAHAEKRQQEAYQHYNTVVVEQDGPYYVKITASDPVTRDTISDILDLSRPYFD